MNPERIVVDTNHSSKDAPFIALTLHLDGRLWTGDDKLKAGLKAKGFDRFFEP